MMVKGPAVIRIVINRLKDLLNDKRTLGIADNITRKNYNKAVADFKISVGDSATGIRPNADAVSFLREYAFENIKGMNDDLAHKLRQQLTEAFLNNESNRDIRMRVQKVMDITDARARAIARTESNRAYSQGAHDAARRSGLDLKKKVHNPAPQSDICKALVKRKAIGVDDTWNYRGDEYHLPPFHVNCRSRVLYVQEDE